MTLDNEPWHRNRKLTAAEMEEMRANRGRVYVNSSGRLCLPIPNGVYDADHNGLRRHPDDCMCDACGKLRGP